jgi:hypothetical protein
MGRARDIASLLTTSSVLATDSEVAALGYLTNSTASSIYLNQANNKPSFRNLVINGDMQIAQRGTSTASITTADYRTADRFRFIPSSMGTWTMSQENDAPTGSGFAKSLKLLCTTADASPAAGDYVRLEQRIEGQNLQHIKKGTSAAEQLTISFWVKTNKIGTYIVEVNDDTNNRSVSKSYTVNASATWEKKTITFPADTTGTIANDNAMGLRVIFWQGVGTSYSSGTLGTTWATLTDANRAVGQVNLADAISNYWQVTGVQLEVGDVATPFEFKPFDKELEECQRYYWKGYVAGGGVFGGSGGSVPIITFTYPVTMRIAPIWTWISGGVASNGNVDLTITGINSSAIQADSARLLFTISGSSGANTQGCAVHNALSSFNAEL